MPHTKDIKLPGIKPRDVKMDTSRAQSLLGFTSARWMENTTGLEPKDVLDIALREQMYKAIEYKRQVAKDKGSSDKRKTSSTVRCTTDDITILHEAYQFLVKKYIKQRSISKEAQDVEPTKCDQE